LGVGQTVFAVAHGEVVLALFAMSYALAMVTPSLLTIRLGKMVPGYYDDPALEAASFTPWTSPVLVSVVVGLTMFGVDALMQARARRISS